MAAPASSPLAPGARARPSRAAVAGRTLALAAVALTVVAAVLGLVFAGSAGRLAEGVHIAGVDVGGLTPGQAQELLEGRAAELATVPVEFVAGEERWRVTPERLGLKVDYASAVDAARRGGDGFGPVRGFRRLHLRFFGADVAPPLQVYQAALDYELTRFAESVDTAPREAAIELRGLRPVLVAGQTGQTLDRGAAEGVVVRSLAAFSRTPVGLPVRVQPPKVTAADLAPVLAELRVALAAPLRLALGETRWRLPRWRVAELLVPPALGTRELRIGGPGAEAYFERLAAVVERPAQDAGFTADGNGVVSVVPGVDGLALDPEATATAMLAALKTTDARLAQVAVVPSPPALTTAAAEALGITRVLASYSTGYAGSADRNHNLRLGTQLLDGAIVQPGATFSFNDRVGERTVERGFRAAPVIMAGEYEDGIGGGVSQVATTVFNAAWEAGLKIPRRAAHSLYIARYPLGRDATVNYPDLDLQFVNDTEGPLLVRGFVTDSGITVSLWGSPTGRRVESEAGPLQVTGAVPVERTKDPTLFVGEEEVDAEGAPPRSVRVHRVVYDADGDVLLDEWWTTNYRGEKRELRVGTKPKPVEPKPEDEETEETPPVPPKPKTGTEPPPPGSEAPPVTQGS